MPTDLKDFNFWLIFAQSNAFPATNPISNFIFLQIVLQFWAILAIFVFKCEGGDFSVNAGPLGGALL
jgi:hypothetical protein